MLNKHLETCLSAAQSYVDIITNATIDQLQSEGETLDPLNIDLVSVARIAAKRLSIDPDETAKVYCKLMILLDYAEEATP